MSNIPTPRRVEWAGPEGWTVWADEDGVHLRSSGGSSLEMPDVERLFSLWSHARAMTEAGHIDAPKPPTREDIRAMTSANAAKYAQRRAVSAIQREFAPDTTPF